VDENLGLAYLNRVARIKASKQAGICFGPGCGVKKKKKKKKEGTPFGM
jgi:hypothetical protein